MVRINLIKKRYEEYVNKIAAWAEKEHFRLIFFNLIVILLFLLHSVGYFAPYFPITINFIVFLCFVLSVFIFKATSKALFMIAIMFFILASSFRVLQVEAWVDRTMIYVYQALVVGVALLLVEILRKK